MWGNKLIIFPVIVILLLISINSLASAREITVDNDASGADFKSIQEAVNNSSTGDVIIVKPGTYEENIIVNVTSLTLKPESEDFKVLIKSPTEDRSVFLITANDVTLQGFNITGGRGNLTYHPAGICLKNARNCEIKDSALFENSLGIYLINADQNTIAGNLLLNNSISLVEGSNMNNLKNNTLEKCFISLSESDYNTISENSLLDDSILVGNQSGSNNLTYNTIENGSISLYPWASLNLISKNKIIDGYGITIACCGGGDLVSGNTIYNCSHGVDTYDHGISVFDNNIMDCYCGIDISQSPSEIYNNTVLNCTIGIDVKDSYVDIMNNIITSSAECGLSISDPATGERICNNYFNNSINVRLESSENNTWNNSLTSGTNIAGGPYMGGNYWANPNGTGFSETCMDLNGDWICDSPYNVNGSDFDFLPLASISKTQKLPVANFSTNSTQGLSPLIVQFTDSSQFALTWNWDFDNDGISDSTEKDPVYEYNFPGNYTVNLTVSNANGKTSKTEIISAKEAEDLPVANFSANTTGGQAPFTIRFTDFSQNAGKRAWDFNNDCIPDSTNETVIYKYTFPGTYPVNLIVSNSKGTSSKLSTIIVSPVQRVEGRFLLTEYQITTNESYQKQQMAFYEDKIAWVDERSGDPNIYLYNLSTLKEAQITASKSYKFSPYIYGDKIVWTDLRNGNADIYVYNMSTKKETGIITAKSAINPKIYGDRIFWTDSSNDGSGNLSSYDIYMYNLSTSQKTKITTSGKVESLAVYDNRIVWQDLRNGNSDIYMYDFSIAKETQITSNEFGQGNPAIYGDIIVWIDSRNRYPNIYMYNISTSKESQISTNDSLATEPVIYHDKIVWLDGHSKNGSNVYMYDLSTSKEVQITTSGSAWTPNIYGNKIVWVDNRSGNSDIYMCIISELGEKESIMDFSL